MGSLCPPPAPPHLLCLPPRPFNAPCVQVLILWAQGGSKKKLRNRMHATFNPWQPDRSLLRLTWNRDATFLKNITQVGDW